MKKEKVVLPAIEQQRLTLLHACIEVRDILDREANPSWKDLADIQRIVGNAIYDVENFK